jgi:hypothetical protein
MVTIFYFIPTILEKVLLFLEQFKKEFQTVNDVT